MDAGWAAIAGAAVGATGTAVAALITGWWARGQARIQADSQLQQVRLQLRSEQYHQLRAPRIEAYDAFMARVYVVLDKIHNTILDTRDMTRDQARQYVRELKADVDSLQPLWSRVAILGPNSVATKGISVIRDLTETGHAATTFVNAHADGTEERDAARDNLSHLYLSAAGSIGDFIEAARPVLDIDATSVAEFIDLHRRRVDADG